MPAPRPSHPGRWHPTPRPGARFEKSDVIDNARDDGSPCPQGSAPSTDTATSRRRSGVSGWRHEAAERALRGVALGRGNYLFMGSDAGGEHAAAIYSLIETAKLNGVEPYAWLRDVIERMVDGHPANRLDDLLPWNWQVQNPVKQ